MSTSEWGRPYRKSFPGHRIFPTTSCADCEYFEVAAMFSRRCSKNPDTHIWAPGFSPEQERQENGGVQAEVCPSFTLAREILECLPHRCLDCAFFEQAVYPTVLDGGPYCNLVNTSMSDEKSREGNLCQSFSSKPASTHVE